MPTNYDDIIDELKNIWRLGICSLCGEHTTHLTLKIFNIGDRYFAGWVCEQCEDSIDAKREVVSG